MFYFNEIWCRVFFLILYFSLSWLLCFLYKHLFFYFFSLPILTTTNHLIYTNPLEFIISYIFMIMFVSFCFCIVYVIWHSLDFLKSTLYVYEYKLYFNNLYCGGIIFLGFNFFVVYKFLPYIWNSFEQFNFYLTKANALNFFLELKILEYFNFLQYNLAALNTIYCLFVYFSFFSHQVFISHKKFYCLFNIFFSTLISNTDLYSQLCFLVVLQIWFEFYILLKIIKYKFNKSIKIFILSY